MEFLGEAFIALAVLLVVAVAAFSFEPSNPLEPWFRLAQSYGTDRQPSQVTFANQDVLFGVKRGAMKSLSIAAKFDATVDDFGFWLTYKGPLPEEWPETLKVPGTHVRYLGDKNNKFLFELFLESPVRIELQGNLGTTLKSRCGPSE